MIKALLFDVPANRKPILDEPTGWGNDDSVAEALDDFHDMARKSLPLNGEIGETNEFLVKIIDKKTQRSTAKYKIVAVIVPTIAENRVVVKTVPM